jgi:predicted Zn-dependent protease
MRTSYLLLGLFLLLAVGCAEMTAVTDIGSQIAVATGYLNQDQAAALKKTSQAVEKAFTDITVEQEYFIGRAVAAEIVNRYPPLDRQQINTYLNLVGQALARVSDLPETFGGYHFLVLDSDEINAFAAPGGLIFISRGLLRCCPDEDALAAVLAHEIGHVQARHGLQAIKKSRLTDALTIIGTESARQFGGAELAQLTTVFEGSIADVTSTLVNNGYSRSYEYQADQIAIELLGRLGYSPTAMALMLREMEQRLAGDSRGFARTHPSPAERLVKIYENPQVQQTYQVVAARQQRFNRFLKGI